jgi:hypothetical protein
MFVYYPIEPCTDTLITSGQRVAQTRRVGKHNERAYLLSAPRFSPYRSGQDHPDRSLRPLALSTCRLAIKLTRMGGCRTATAPDYYCNSRDAFGIGAVFNAASTNWSKS